MLRSGFAVFLTIGLALPAYAQTAPMVAPVPASPRPAGGSAGATPGGGNKPEQQQRLRQGGSPSDTAASTREGRTLDAARATPASPAGALDDRHVRDVMAAGTVALQASTFARTKAQHPRVRRSAEWEEAEQTLMFDVLHGLAEPAATASTASGQATTAPVISDQGSAAMERMSQAQPGPAFDRDYVDLQLAKHRELAAIHERFLGRNPANHEQATIAKLALGQVREHIAHLEDIAQELSGSQQ